MLRLCSCVLILALLCSVSALVSRTIHAYVCAASLAFRSLDTAVPFTLRDAVNVVVHTGPRVNGEFDDDGVSSSDTDIHVHYSKMLRRVIVPPGASYIAVSRDSESGSQPLQFVPKNGSKEWEFDDTTYVRVGGRGSILLSSAVDDGALPSDDPSPSPSATPTPTLDGVW